MSPEIPSQGEIRRRLGPGLADAFFELSNPGIKSLIGLGAPLAGPGRELWCSPSDQLTGKRRMKPAPPSRILQLVTHKGVLELGEGLLKQHEVELTGKLRKSLFSELKNVELLMEAEQRRLADDRIRRIREECDWRLGFLSREYDKKLDEALERVVNKYNRILLKAVVETRMDVTREMMKRMREEMSFVVADIRGHYDRKSCRERQSMIAEFNEVIRRERVELGEQMAKFREERIEELEVSAARLENESAARVEKFVGLERSRCEGEKERIFEKFKGLVASLEESLMRANREIAELRERPAILLPGNEEFWRNRAHHVLKEFEKFIGFVLSSDPQRNFLLPRDSLLQFPESEKTENQS